MKFKINQRLTATVTLSIQRRYLLKLREQYFAASIHRHRCAATSIIYQFDSLMKGATSAFSITYEISAISNLCPGNRIGAPFAKI